MLMVRTRLGKSPIHGLGCFADEFIPKHCRVWRLTPGFDLVWTQEEYSKLFPAVLYNIRDHVYQCKFSNNWIYCSDDARFFNHSENPNVNDGGIGGFDIALRDIQPGEELTCDYNTFCISNAGCTTFLCGQTTNFAHLDDRAFK